MSFPNDHLRFVVLRSGPVVPLSALRLLWRLEEAGFQFGLTEHGEPWIAPFAQLGERDCAELRRWKRHIRALLHHFESTPTDAHLDNKAPASTA